MFTGLIREFAQVKDFKNGLLTLSADYAPKIGDSMAVNGACLTVVEAKDESFSVELSYESKSILAVENLQKRVHIEPAMAFGDRLEGHIVQGHVDCIGKIERIEKKESSYDFFIQAPKDFIKFIIPKGSVTVDGVSLTVNDVDKKSFRLTIIPHTIKNTLFEEYGAGRRVNIETDMFARYLYHMFDKNKDDKSWRDIDRIMASY